MKLTSDEKEALKGCLRGLAEAIIELSGEGIRKKYGLKLGGEVVEVFLTTPPKAAGRRRPGYCYGELAVHRPAGGGKGWMVTDTQGLYGVLRTRLKKEAEEARKELEAVWADRQAANKLLLDLRARVGYP